MSQGYSHEMIEMKYPETPVRILLGGGIGSGKSIAARRFEELGANVVEADRLGHQLLERDGEAFDAVSERWPSVIVDGQVDRSALAEIVFADREELADLETVTHPSIVRNIGELALDPSDLVVEVPLILGVPGRWTRAFLDADEDIRVCRAIDRGGNEADMTRRMAVQPHRSEWMAWADETVDNNGSTHDLREQLDDLWHRLQSTL
jgi:dephospho-CoA kinase